MSCIVIQRKARLEGVLAWDLKSFADNLRIVSNC